MEIIDLRSDTITKPTPEMRSVMAQAHVGDDVFGDDPTVNELEDKVAELLGKESAIFMPSGTMANQIALRCHTNHGDEMLIDANAHIYWYEAGAPAALSGITAKHLHGIRGVFARQDILNALRPVDNHFPPTTLLTVENTHNRGGGAVWPIDKIGEVCETAKENNLKTHLDGARLWNASVASGIPEAGYASHFDSVSVCFSKGLGAPVGSALAGTNDFITRARRFRKQFGGGMRQAGIIAAAALFAVENNRERLKQDHENAKLLALGLSEISGITINTSEVETNMVYFELQEMDAPSLAKRLAENGVWVLAVGDSKIRAVCSLMVDKQDIVRAIDIVKKTMA